MTSLQQLGETIQARIECRTVFITVVLCVLALLAAYVLRRWWRASATTNDGGVGSREYSAPRASASTTANNAGSVPDESTPLNDPADEQPAREAPFDARRHTNPRNRDGNDTRLTPPFVPPSPSMVHRGGLGSGAENTAASEVPGIDNITDPAEDARDLAARRILRGHQQRRSTANRGPRPAASPWRAVASSASGGRSRTGMRAPATSSAFSPYPRPAPPEKERSVHAQQASEEDVRRVSVMVDEAAATSGVADTAVTTAVQGRRRGASGAAPAPSTGFASAMSNTANATPVRPPRAPTWWPPPPSNSAAANTAAAATVAVSTTPTVATATWEGAPRATGRTAASSALSTERRSAVPLPATVTPVQPPGVALPWPTFSSAGAAATATTAAATAATTTSTDTSAAWKRNKTAMEVTAATPAPSNGGLSFAPTATPLRPPRPSRPVPAVLHSGATPNTAAATTRTTIAAAATWKRTQRTAGVTAAAPAPSTERRSAISFSVGVTPVQPPGVALPWPTFSSTGAPPAAAVATTTTLSFAAAGAAAAATTTTTSATWKRTKTATGATAAAPAPSPFSTATTRPSQPPQPAWPWPAIPHTGAPGNTAAAAAAAATAATAGTSTTIAAAATWNGTQRMTGATAVAPAPSTRKRSASFVTATVAPVQPPGAASPWPTFSSAAASVATAAAATSTTTNAPVMWKRAKGATGVTAVAPAPSKRNISAISVIATVTPVQPPGAALPRPTFSSTGAPPAAAVATTATINAPATWKRAKTAAGVTATAPGLSKRKNSAISVTATVTPVQPPGAALPWPTFSSTGVPPAAVATTTTINAPATWKRAKTAAGVTAVAPAPSKRKNSAISVNATVAPVQPPGAALPWPTFSSTGAPPAAAVATTTTINAPATSKRTRGATGALAATAAPRTATGLGLSFAPTATPTQPPRAAWPVPAYTPTGGVATIATTTPATAATLTATAAPSIGKGSGHSYTATAPLLHLHHSRMPDTSTSTSNGSTAPSKQIGKATEANIVHCCAADDGEEEGWVRAPYLDHEDGKEVAGAFVYLPVTVLRPAREEGCKCAGGDHAVWVRPGCSETFEWAFEDAGVIGEVPSSAILHKGNAAVVGSEKVPECIGKTCDRCPCDRSECSWTPDGLELLCNYCADAPRRDVCNHAELRGYGQFRWASACDCKGW